MTVELKRPKEHMDNAEDYGVTAATAEGAKWLAGMICAGAVPAAFSSLSAATTVAAFGILTGVASKVSGHYSSKADMERHDANASAYQRITLDGLGPETSGDHNKKAGRLKKWFSRAKKARWPLGAAGVAGVAAMTFRTAVLHKPPYSLGEVGAFMSPAAAAGYLAALTEFARSRGMSHTTLAIMKGHREAISGEPEEATPPAASAAKQTPPAPAP